MSTTSRGTRLTVIATRGPAFALALAAALAIAMPAAAGQIAIPRVERMPNIPQPFAMKDWRAHAVAYDKFVFDFSLMGEHLPLVWIDNTKANYDLPGFGLPTYVGSPKRGEGSHEGINCLGAVLGATLVGIDKSKGPINFVLACQRYFNKANGQNVILNGTRAGTGGSFWYELWPSILFFALAERYPGTGEMDACVRTHADRWAEACSVLAGGGDGAADFDHLAFDFKKMAASDNGKHQEPEGAAGAAWIEYAAYAKWKDPKHLRAAESAVRFLQKRSGPVANPYYEILLPWGALAAARLNAELGREYDVPRFVTWCFDGDRTPRGSWGVIADRWGRYDASGLVGSLTDTGGYGFAMNTFAQAGAMAPLVRYDNRFARAIGKYMLNAANAARLFYADALPEENQSSAFWKGDPRHVISYEGVRKTWEGKSPYATGDAVRGKWAATDFALYGGSYVGFFGGIIGRTEDEKILRLDCLATDFYRDRAYPTYLYYNPYMQARQVTADVGGEPRDLYDAAADRFMARGVTGKAAFTIPADSAVVLVIVPAGGKATRDGRKLLVNGVVIDYSAP